MESKETIYIAGPMRGYPLYNFPAFDAAARFLREQGHRVINPAELDRVAGIHEYTNPLPPGFLREAMKRDLVAICDCTALAYLPGWEKSGGVKVERTLADFIGLKSLFLK